VDCPGSPSAGSFTVAEQKKECKVRSPYLLKLGKTVITPGALEEITKAEQTPLEFLIPHIHCNWGGGVSQEDKGLNNWAVENG